VRLCTKRKIYLPCENRRVAATKKNDNKKCESNLPGKACEKRKGEGGNAGGHAAYPGGSSCSDLELAALLQKTRREGVQKPPPVDLQKA